MKITSTGGSDGATVQATQAGANLPRTGVDALPFLALSAGLLVGGAGLLRLSGMRLQRSGRRR